MAVTNYDLFWEDFQSHCELSKLHGVLDELELDPIIELIRRHRKFSGRTDWPVGSMLKALFAMAVLQHRSTASFVRELRRNPTLMIMLGFSLRAAPHDPVPDSYRVPTESAFCRFRKTLLEVDEQSDCLRQLFHGLVGQLRELLPDFGVHTGFDGKAIESHSSGRKLAHKVDVETDDDDNTATSDPDARWGRHDQYGTDANGKEVRRTKTWFGYQLNLVGDVTYELPIDYRLTPANASEQVQCRAQVRELLETPLGSRMESFVADRGLDGNELRRILFDAGVLGVIDTRNLWQDVNPHPDQLRVATRPLDDSRTDTMVHTECGDVYCLSPDEDRQLRAMYYQGYEAARGTLKWVCPAAVYEFECKGREECWRMGGVKPGAKARIVRTRLDADHLRNGGPLPHNSYKWKRHYRRRSALERINSRIDNGFLMHDHFLRGQRQMELRVGLSLTVMLAAACSAIKAGKPAQMRSLVRPLAA